MRVSRGSVDQHVEAIITKTRGLQEFVLAGDFREVSGGDDGRTRLRLVPLDLLKSKLAGAKIIALDAEAVA